MKKSLILSIALMASIALVGCDYVPEPSAPSEDSSEQESISQDISSSDVPVDQRAQFLTALEKNKASFENDNPALKNIYTDEGDAIHASPTNFIDGEFYIWKSIGQRFGLWRDENGDYHRAEKKTLLYAYEDKIITEEQFHEEMEVKKAELIGKIRSCVEMAEAFLAEDEAGSDRQLSLVFKTSFAGNFRLEASYVQTEQVWDETVVNEDETTGAYVDVEVTYTHLITLGADLPTRYAIAKDGNTTDASNFKYGCAQFVDLNA